MQQTNGIPDSREALKQRIEELEKIILHSEKRIEDFGNGVRFLDLSILLSEAQRIRERE